ncbi:Crp/Fnr family transcriptional regulator [Mucilaginibacter achroorhodeus]|uniref:Crp/Fnr family transcriptional regulator n=1 Tax=Mucilaginibacter achroorhodeus TaxID=2599294 RepID=A0A563U016_9SPHI|nr:Crp/Fnr family transcriptional regulator [Mucilaginibacter achroorhodeus]TWR24873.1 Crp/Fnr family transcriptional regulator [Mucilaginibacter achroorhodeus]
MMNNFRDYAKEYINLNDEEIGLMLSVATEKKVRRKDMLLQAGEICRHKIFILEGMLRLYRTRDDGGEHNMYFAPEYHWMTEPESLNNATPTLYNIEAVEDAHLLLWAKRDFVSLSVAIPKLKVYSENIISRNLAMTRERVFNTMSATVEERYDDFVRTYPDIFNRIPLHMVASYLGVSLKTLTRVRHAQVKR